MKTNELMNELKACGIPCAFVRFEEPQTTPFCILRADDTSNIYSDTAFFEQIDTYTVELYYRDPADREAFEAFLCKHFRWERSGTDSPVDDSVLMSWYEIL